MAKGHRPRYLTHSAKVWLREFEPTGVVEIQKASRGTQPRRWGHIDIGESLDVGPVCLSSRHHPSTSWLDDETRGFIDRLTSV